MLMVYISLFVYNIERDIYINIFIDVDWCVLQDKVSYRDDMFGFDEEDNYDVYLERMKVEGKDRQSGDEDDDSDSLGKWLIVMVQVS